MSATTNAPSQKEIDAAIEKSAQYLAAQNEPPESHTKPTTPTKAEIDAALEKSADYLESQGYTVTREGYTPSPGAATPVAAVGPGVSFAGTQTAADSAPVDASRDTSNDSPQMTAKNNETTTADKKKD